MTGDTALFCAVSGLLWPVMKQMPTQAQKFIPDLGNRCLTKAIVAPGDHQCYVETLPHRAERHVSEEEDGEREAQHFGWGPPGKGKRKKGSKLTLV